MTPEFLRAVIDALLPGAPMDGPHAALPGGTAAGVALTEGAGHAALLQAIADRAGGIEAFVRAAEPSRVAVLEAVARAMPADFQRLVQFLLMDYYEAGPVLTAMGWRTAPPQPQGHAMDPFDAALLANVRRRGKLWRG